MNSDTHETEALIRRATHQGKEVLMCAMCAEGDEHEVGNTPQNHSKLSTLLGHPHGGGEYEGNL